jgi:hypothetical protein
MNGETENYLSLGGKMYKFFSLSSSPIPEDLFYGPFKGKNIGGTQRLFLV